MNHVKTIITKFKVIIHVEWISAYLGIPGNERADRLADKAAKNEKNEYENVGYTLFIHFKVLARQSTLRDWLIKILKVFKANTMGRYYK
jgi:hypothetical protein